MSGPTTTTNWREAWEAVDWLLAMARNVRFHRRTQPPHGRFELVGRDTETVATVEALAPSTGRASALRYTTIIGTGPSSSAALLDAAQRFADGSMTCSCGHLRAEHAHRDDEVLHCNVPCCACTAFQWLPEHAGKAVDPRRVYEQLAPEERARIDYASFLAWRNATRVEGV